MESSAHAFALGQSVEQLASNLMTYHFYPHAWFQGQSHLNAYKAVPKYLWDKERLGSEFVVGGKSVLSSSLLYKDFCRSWCEFYKKYVSHNVASRQFSTLSKELF